MITIREIISLVKNYGLMNAKFYPDDSSKVPIEIINGVGYFKHKKDLPIGDLEEEEIRRIDEENSYFTPEVYQLEQKEE